jgi:N6-L-threonylcarbamoyladenine synthase
VIDRRARDGDDRAVALPKQKFTHADRHAPPPELLQVGNRPLSEFSFSGLKTAVMRELAQRGVAAVAGPAGRSDAGPLSDQDVSDFCASFQRVVVETLVERSFDAVRATGAQSLGIAGGVSANSRLRRDAAARGERDGIPVFVPALSLSTDNAAMIAAAGLRALARSGASPLSFNASASLPMPR